MPRMHSRNPKEEAVKAFQLFDDDTTGSVVAPWLEGCPLLCLDCDMPTAAYLCSYFVCYALRTAFLWLAQDRHAVGYHVARCQLRAG